MSRLPKYLQTDEQLDVLCSLELCRDLLVRCDSDPTLWKWIIITLQNAVHGAIVCHLSGSLNIGAYTKECADAKRAFVENDVRDRQMIENPKLAGPMELLNRLGNQSRQVEDAGGHINITVDEKESFQKLCNLRNEFLHFKPQGWSLQINGYADAICRNVLGILGKVISAEHAFRHLPEGMPARMKEAVQAISQKLESS